MNDDFQDLIPVRKCDFEVNNELVTILQYKKKNNFIEKFLLKNKKVKPNRIDLDKLGTFVWNLFDGYNKVSQIIELTKSKFGDSEDQLENRVEVFVRQLNQNHFITLYAKKD